MLLENVLEESWCAAIRLPYRLRSKVRRLSCASKTFLCIKEFLLEGEVLLEYFLAEGEAILGDFLVEGRVLLEDFLDEGEVLLEDFFLEGEAAD